MNGLHESLVLECLVRLDSKDLPSASRVCLQWLRLIRTRHFHTLRKQLGYSNHVGCLLQSSTLHVSDSSTTKSSVENYVISVFDPVNLEWNRLPRIPKLPEFTILASCEGKLVAMSDSDPDSLEHVTSVFVWDFATQRCWKGKDMLMSSRLFYYMVGEDSRIFVACGEDRIPGCNMFDTVCVYDVRKDEWNELPRMSQKRGVGEAMIIGDELWVINGCLAKYMGVFEHNAEVYHFKTEIWRRVEWDLGVDDSCPYCSCSLVKIRKWLRRWAQVIRNKLGLISGLQLGEECLLWYYIFLYSKDGNLEIMDVPTEFSNYVHSNCWVEF